MSSGVLGSLDGMEAKNLGTLYDLPLVEWSAIERRLGAGLEQAPDTGGPNRHTCWLATIDADGSPHVTGIGSHWHDGSFWFTTSLQSRKGKNLARDPRCTLSVATQEFDLTIEGEAELVTDPATVAELVEVYSADGGWPAEVDESGTAFTAPFSAPSAGPPPWHLHRIRHQRAMALVTEGEGGATRFEF
jgi:PPOX class probable F420-dependent enzyme